MRSPSPARLAAFRLLSGKRTAVDDLGLAEEDLSLATEISQGVLRHRGRLDYELRTTVHVASLPPSVRDILRMGLFQLRLLDRVPAYAAVADTVDLARTLRAEPRLVNAVLRRLSDRPPIALPEAGEPLLTLTLSLPQWLSRRWLKSYGMDRTEDFARAALERPALHLAPNTLRTATDALAQSLAAEGVLTQPDGLLLSVSHGNPTRTRAFAEGLFYVMGPSSHAVARLAIAGIHDPVLDVCSAPGGKLIQMRLAGARDLTGTDIHRSKIERIRENFLRMRLDIAKLLVADLSRTSPFARSFRTILLDAPCTGLGVLCKLPEIKWRLGEKDIRRAARKQAQLLTSSFGLLAPGGTLVYSVCSLEPEEGDRLISRFLHETPSAVLDPSTVEELQPDRDGLFRFFPRPGMQDGFFAARIRRLP